MVSQTIQGVVRVCAIGTWFTYFALEKGGGGTLSCYCVLYNFIFSSLISFNVLI